MYAIIEVADKQYKVSKDVKLYVPLLKADVNESITIDDVLLISDNGTIKVGSPTVKGASVSATVLEHVKADKVLVFKKKRRKRFKVKKGHRQQYTKLQINELIAGGAAKKAKKAKAKKTAEPAAVDAEPTVQPETED